MSEVNYWRNLFYDLLEEVEQMYGKEDVWDEFKKIADELDFSLVSGISTKPKRSGGEK